MRRAQPLYEKVKGTSIPGRHKARVASYEDDADDDGDGDDGDDGDDCYFRLRDMSLCLFSPTIIALLHFLSVSFIVTIKTVSPTRLSVCQYQDQEKYSFSVLYLFWGAHCLVCEVVGFGPVGIG